MKALTAVAVALVTTFAVSAADAQPSAPVAPSAGPEEVRVRSAPRERKPTVQTEVRAEDAAHVAGGQGDAAQVVQTLPGVSRAPLGSGQIVLWGASPSESKILVDGVEIPYLYHASGVRSVIPTDSLQSVGVVPGGFGPEYGRATGGLVRLTTRALPEEGHGAYVSVDPLDVGAGGFAALGGGATAQVTGRWSVLKGVLDLVSAPELADTFLIPSYGDLQSKVSWNIAPKKRVELVVLGSTDSARRTAPRADPGRVRSREDALDFFRVYSTYRAFTDDGEGVSIVPFFGRDVLRRRQSADGAPSVLNEDSARYGVRTETRGRVSKSLVTTLGLDVQGVASSFERSGTLVLPPREGDVTAFGLSPADEISADTWKVHTLNVAPHIRADLDLGPVTLSPGIRLETYVIEGSRLLPKLGPTPSIGFSRFEVLPEPRVAARVKLDRRLAFVGAAGLYDQPPDAADLSAVFGTPALAPTRATHITVGEELRAGAGIAIELSGFHRSLADVTVRSRSAAPFYARSLVQNGEARSYGVQLLVKRELTKGLFGWIAYTASRSERRYQGDAGYRPADFDEPHVLATVLSQQVGEWTFGARFRVASGLPRTEVVGHIYDARRDLYFPRFGVQNRDRLPTFHELDLRVERRFDAGGGVRLAVYAEMLNATFAKNAEDFAYSADWTRRDVVRGLPTLGLLGLRGEL